MINMTNISVIKTSRFIYVLMEDTLHYEMEYALDHSIFLLNAQALAMRLAVTATNVVLRDVYSPRATREQVLLFHFNGGRIIDDAPVVSPASLWDLDEEDALVIRDNATGQR